MNKGSNTPTPDPQLAGLGEKQLGTQEQAIAHTWFAGPRPLRCNWIMQAVNLFSRETSEPKGIKNFQQRVINDNWSGLAFSVDPLSPLWSNQDWSPFK